MATTPRPIETPRDQWIEDFRRRRLPLLVWSVAALLAAWLLTGRALETQYVGLAQALPHEIAASVTGQVQRVAVEVYDAVEPGDVLVELDDTTSAAMLQTAQATLSQLRAELDAEKAELRDTDSFERAGWSESLRRFQIDEEERRLEGLNLEVTIESDQIELDRLAAELRRSEPLVARGLIAEWELDEKRRLHDRLKTAVQENRSLLDQTTREYEAAKARRAGFQQRTPGPIREEPRLKPLVEAIAVQNRLIEEIQTQRAQLVLRSPVAGQVTQILCREGRSVVPGEPVLIVTGRSAGEILAFLPETDARQVTQDTRVRVSSPSRRDAVVESVVVRVGNVYDLMPERLWVDRTHPAWGRTVVIAAVPELELAPGERVGIRFLSR